MYRKFVWPLTVLCLSLPSHVSSTSIESKVNLGYGSFQGKGRSSSGVLEFLGIPFAAPPVGNLRWKPPQAVSQSAETMNATSFGDSCIPADPTAPSFGPQSEDCLTINVWTAAQDTDEKRPVMVWIYGGGFQFGTASQPNYNGTNLARHDVVIVTFNYRLGVLGFLGLQELDQEGTNSGNFGLQDQLAALRWVQENVAKFGGDPDSVTLFGESAGAHAIGLLLTSKHSGGLFHKCILESGAYWDSEHGSLSTRQQTREKGATFQRKLGAKSVEELRSIPAAMVNNAALWNSSTDPGITAFSPSIDDYIVSVAPGTAFRNGQTMKIPMLAGFNFDEQLLFLPRALPHSTALEYQVSAKTFFGSHSKEALALYPGCTQQQAMQSAQELVGDLVIRQQTFEALDGQSKSSGKPCYGYHFTYTSAYSPKAAHAAEVNFVFGNLGPNPIFGSTPPPSPADVQMSQNMMKYWTNFAKTGTPNDANDQGLVHWPTYSSDGIGFLNLGSAIAPTTVPNSDRHKFIRSLRSNGVLPTQWRHEFVDN